VFTVRKEVSDAYFVGGHDHCCAVGLTLELLYADNQILTKKRAAARLWRVATIPRPLAGYRQKQVAGNSINLLIINILQKKQSVSRHLLPARGRGIVAIPTRRDGCVNYLKISQE
jgi:hypothetical protein